MVDGVGGWVLRPIARLTARALDRIRIRMVDRVQKQRTGRPRIGFLGFGEVRGSSHLKSLNGGLFRLEGVWARAMGASLPLERGECDREVGRWSSCARCKGDSLLPRLWR